MLRWVLLGAILLFPAPAQAAPTKEDEAEPRAAGIKLETEALLRFVESRAGKPMPAARVKELAAQLGDDSFDKREAAPRRGSRQWNLERLPLKEVLLWLRHQAEEELGRRDEVPAGRPMPRGPAG
ncbi:MAG: hypothetical protein K2W96_02400 [Gemmataceae bacterium]|nr:hypothetical protein [Gemmataceae bacterium]